MMPSPETRLTVPPKRSTARNILAMAAPKTSSAISGSMLEVSATDPRMSANMIVTILRSPTETVRIELPRHNLRVNIAPVLAAPFAAAGLMMGQIGETARGMVMPSKGAKNSKAIGEPTVQFMDLTDTVRPVAW